MRMTLWYALSSFALIAIATGALYSVLTAVHWIVGLGAAAALIAHRILGTGRRGATTPASRGISAAASARPKTETENRRMRMTSTDLGEHDPLEAHR
jgi:hypothetical protein